MKTTVRRLLVLPAGLLLALGLHCGLVEGSGDVAVLTTTSADGAEHTTRLWVVEHRGAPWLRAS